MSAAGPFWFGVVVGYITYRTLRHKAASGLSDIASVIGAIGGGAVLQLFPQGSAAFEHYAKGLAAGFFTYLALSLVIAGWFAKREGSAAKGGKAANEFLGE
jgi:zinc transporter ZupT